MKFYVSTYSLFLWVNLRLLSHLSKYAIPKHTARKPNVCCYGLPRRGDNDSSDSEFVTTVTQWASILACLLS